jgi:hypothetical protein
MRKPQTLIPYAGAEIEDAKPYTKSIDLKQLARRIGVQKRRIEMQQRLIEKLTKRCSSARTIDRAQIAHATLIKELTQMENAYSRQNEHAKRAHDAKMARIKILKKWAQSDIDKDAHLE